MRRSLACIVTIAALLGAARPARADWLLTPFAGATFNTDTVFLDLDGVARRPHIAYGIALTWFPERVFGVNLETSVTPSLFTGHDLVEASRLVTAIGSVMIALPQSVSRIVRPYATIGAGLVQVRSTDIASIFPIDSTRPAASAGLGAWLPITARLGARADLRFVRSGSGSSSSRFETWQASVGAAIRF